MRSYPNGNPNKDVSKAVDFVGVALRLGGALAALTMALAMGGCAGDIASSLKVDVATTWADTPPVDVDGKTPLRDALSLRLEPDGTAYVAAFPRGETVLRQHNGRTTQCVETSSADTYTGAAKWKVLDSTDISVTYGRSNVTLNAASGRFASIDWGELLFAACNDLSSPWQLFKVCGATDAYSPPPCPRNPSVAPSQRGAD